MTDIQRSSDDGRVSLVLYCLICRVLPETRRLQFLLVEKQGQLTFPPTKFRPTEDLYHALVRPMEEDLGLPADSYFPEDELKLIPSAGESPRYPGLTKHWHLYPVVISLTDEGRHRLESSPIRNAWLTLDEILAQAVEPNVRAIAMHLCSRDAERLTTISAQPSMDALAGHWAASQQAGFRMVRNDQIRQILDAGSRAFNLRVADPYLPYQRQGFGFTWSFFTPKDKQDVHVHGIPAVEIYGVLEGRLQIWHKPMNQRGVRTWQCRTLHTGDWAEVEPLSCHFACWLTPQGLGTVIKASAGGELAGVGKLGVSGKTTCQHCNVCSQCVMPPTLQELIEQYGRPHAERDYERIESLAVLAEREISPHTS